MLSFIPGEVAQRPWPEVMLEEEGLAEVARFLARYHNSDLLLEEYRRTETLVRQGLHPWSIFDQRGDLADLEEENTWLKENYDSLAE